MDENIEAMIAQIRHLEKEIERKLAEEKRELRYRLENRRVIFEKAVLDQHRRLRTGLIKFLRSSPLLNILTAPVIYAMIIPLAHLDLFIWVYQRVCFSAWGIDWVKRADYIVIDRRRLRYLNGIQKLNCVFCGYANGLIAFVREVASRTEQYWCPIKHALRVPATHDRYRDFAPYGDAETFINKADELRKKLKTD